MDLNHVEAFLAVCKYNGFTNASKHMHVSQSTLSRWVASLEKDLGAELLQRTSQGIELTEAGLLFRTEGADMLQHYQAVRSMLAEYGSGAKGHIRVGMPLNLFGQNAVLGIYNKELELPDIEIRYSLLDFDALNSGLLNRSLDVAITYDFAIRNIEDSITKKFVFKEPFVFFAGKDHPLCREDNVTILKLIQYGLTIIDTDINPPFLNHVLHERTKARSGKLRMAKNHESMLMQVATSNTVGVCPKTLYESFKELYGLMALPVTEIDTTADFVMAWRRDDDNPLIRVYNDHIRRYIWNRTV